MENCNDIDTNHKFEFEMNDILSLHIYMISGVSNYYNGVNNLYIY